MQYSANLPETSYEHTEAILTLLGNHTDWFNRLWFELNANQQDAIVIAIDNYLEAIATNIQREFEREYDFETISRSI